MITKDTPITEQWEALYNALDAAIWNALVANKPNGAAVEQLRQDVLAALIETAPTPELIADMASDLTIIRYGELWSPERTHIWMQQCIKTGKHATVNDLALTIATALGQPGHADVFVPLARHYWSECGCVQANLTMGRPALVDWAVGYEPTELL